MDILFLTAILIVIGIIVAKFVKQFSNMPAIFKFLIEVGYVFAAAICFLKAAHVI